MPHSTFDKHTTALGLRLTVCAPPGSRSSGAPGPAAPTVNVSDVISHLVCPAAFSGVSGFNISSRPCCFSHAHLTRKNATSLAVSAPLTIYTKPLSVATQACTHLQSTSCGHTTAPRARYAHDSPLRASATRPRLRLPSRHPKHCYDGSSSKLRSSQPTPCIALGSHTRRAPMAAYP